MERQIRVLVADRLKLMREVIIEAFSDQPDIEIVGEVQEESEIVPRVQETHPDFVFIDLDDPEKRPALCDAVLRVHPSVNIIAVAPHSNRTVCYWASYDIHSRILESSEPGILEAVRRRTSLSGGTA